MKKIPLSRGYFALVDDEDFEYLMTYKWSAHIQQGGDVVAVRNIKRNRKSNIIYMHRVVMETPKGLLVDHIDHNTLNNQKYNLRNCTQKQNKQNCLSRRKGEYKGVSTCSGGSSRFRAYIRGKHLGCFSTKEEAAMAYNREAVRLYGNFACLNEIKSIS